MKAIMLFLLALGLLAIPGLAKDQNTEVVMASCPDLNLASPGDSIQGGQPWAAMPARELQDPEFLATTVFALCPAFRPCTGGCFSGTPCAFTDTGSRCCITAPSAPKACCPAGQTVHQVNCPCIGTGCTPVIDQRAFCL